MMPAARGSGNAALENRATQDRRRRFVRFDCAVDRYYNRNNPLAGLQ